MIKPGGYLSSLPIEYSDLLRAVGQLPERKDCSGLQIFPGGKFGHLIELFELARGLPQPKYVLSEWARLLLGCRIIKTSIAESELWRWAEKIKSLPDGKRESAFAMPLFGAGVPFEIQELGKIRIISEGGVVTASTISSLIISTRV
jgi:hypothetical protein